MLSVFSGNRPVALAAIVLLLCPAVGPAHAQAEEPPVGVVSAPEPAPEPEGEAQLLGRIKDADGKTPLVGVTVVAYHMSKDKVFRSEPTNKKGDFRLQKLPLGYYDVAIELADGSFYVGNTVVNLPPSGKAIITLTVSPFGASDDPGRQWGNAATGSTGEGVARVGRKMTKKEFWKSPKGIAIIAGIGGGALLLLAAGGAEDEEVASPTTPF